MAKLGIRPDPSPHTVLVLDDDRSTHNAAWGLAQGELISVNPGERITVHWQSAHSIGSSGSGQARYSVLPVGNYRFWVATARSNGDLFGEAISFPFSVVAPFYTRWQFWVPLVLLGGGFAFWGGSHWNRHRLKKRFAHMEREHALERERTRIARDLHDDVGAGLTEIAMQSNWVLRDIQATASPDTRRRIERVCESAVELTRSVDEIVWAVNPANDTLDRFVNYLKQASKLFLDAAGLRVRFDIPHSVPTMELAGRLRHGLFLSVREALNNVVKHAQADLVKIELRLERSTLHLIVEDDGHGFDPSLQIDDGTHEGLDGMRRRMEEIGGSFQLSSAPDRSTRIEFTLPLPNLSAPPRTSTDLWTP
jgi:signal transduction histidine kinase